MQIQNSYSLAGLGLDQKNHAEATKDIQKTVAQKSTEAKSEEATKNRETYGLPLLEGMSDDEYDAFVRATKGLDETKIERAGQTLQLVASAYQNAQQIMSGGALLAALNGQEPPSLLADLKSLNVQKAINEGIDVLKRMNETDQRESVRTLERMAMALTQRGLSLQG